MARRVVRIANLADENGWIDDQTFEDCEIVGPAVLVPTACTFQDNEFAGPYEQHIFPLPRPVFGPVGLRNCTFRRCHFAYTIGIAGGKEKVERLLEDFLRQ